MIMSGSKVAWITGCSRGLGRAMCRGLAARGWTVAGCARSEEGVRALGKELGSPHFFARADVVDEDQVGSFCATALEATGAMLTPEGNAHQAEFTIDNRFFIGTDEDFAPYRTDEFTPFSIGYVDLGPVIVEGWLVGRTTWTIGEPVRLVLAKAWTDGDTEVRTFAFESTGAGS